MMTSPEYKELLIYLFGDDIVFIDDFTDGYLKILHELTQEETFEDDACKAIKIANNTKFCFVLDDREVGIFQDKYIVAFNAGVAGFDFIGDTLSNWIDYFGPNSNNSEGDSFKLLCHQKFNTPITMYDRWDNSCERIIKDLFEQGCLMKTIDIMRSETYKKLLLQSFDFGEKIKFNNIFPDEILNDIKSLIVSKTIDDPYFRTLKIYDLVEFFIVFDDRYIGVFNNKYIICFDEHTLDFEFIGDTVSNWIEHFAKHSYEKEINFFKLKCHEQFNIPVTDYDEWDRTPLLEVDEILSKK